MKGGWNVKTDNSTSSFRPLPQRFPVTTQNCQSTVWGGRRGLGAIWAQGFEGGEGRVLGRGGGGAVALALQFAGEARINTHL